MAITNEKIFDKLLEVSEAVAVMTPIVADLKKAVITGNGTPSLLQRVKTIEDYHEQENNVKKDKKEKKEKISARTWAVILIFVTQGLGLLVLFIRTGGIK